MAPTKIEAFVQDDALKPSKQWGSPEGGLEWRFMDVRTKAEGRHKLAALNALVAFVLLFGLYWMGRYMANVSAGNADARDMVDDFSDTKAGVQAHHYANFYNTSKFPKDLSKFPQLHACHTTRGASPGCTYDKLTPKAHRKSALDQKDPLLPALKLGLMKLAQTDYKRDYRAASYKAAPTPKWAGSDAGLPVLAVKFGDLDASLGGTSWLTPGGALTKQEARVPLYRAAYSPSVWSGGKLGKVTVSYLNKVKLHVGKPKGVSTTDYQNISKWGIYRVEPTYTDTAPVLATGWAGYPSSSLVVPIEVHDLSEPRAQWPVFTGIWGFTTGFVMAVLALPLCCLRGVLELQVHRNYRQNQGLPAPFVGSMSSVRGW